MYAYVPLFADMHVFEGPHLIFPMIFYVWYTGSYAVVYRGIWNGSVIFNFTIIQKSLPILEAT